MIGTHSNFLSNIIDITPVSSHKARLVACDPQAGSFYVLTQDMPGTGRAYTLDVVTLPQWPVTTNATSRVYDISGPHPALNGTVVLIHPFGNTGIDMIVMSHDKAYLERDGHRTDLVPIRLEYLNFFYLDGLTIELKNFTVLEESVDRLKELNGNACDALNKVCDALNINFDKPIEEQLLVDAAGVLDSYLDSYHNLDGFLRLTLETMPQGDKTAPRDHRLIPMCQVALLYAAVRRYSEFRETEGRLSLSRVLAMLPEMRDAANRLLASVGIEVEVTSDI